MDKSQMKLAGIVCLVVCAISVFVAVERYNANANNVGAMNQFQQNAPFGGMGVEMTPATPAATRYAAFLAILAGAGGVFLLVKSRSPAD